MVQQLDTMEKERVISPVKYAEWAAPIVPVLESDKESLRICGDYKRTINQATNVKQYPLPWIEDLFTALAGGGTYIKLDLSQAYTQIPLDPSVKKFTVINTPRGLYRYKPVAIRHLVSARGFLKGNGKLIASTTGSRSLSR